MMKRSHVNEIITEGDAFFRSFGVVLPPFAYWSPDQIRSPQAAEIRRRDLGWDVTDYDENRFDDLGLFLFTTRNGLVADLVKGRGMLYAEKLMISRKNQLSPMHRHNIKAEDIINRGGGDLIVELYASDAEGNINRNKPVTVLSDGIENTVPAGGHMRLEPGQSITLFPGDWHAFWAEKADCLIGEVSTVNDDNTDNVFEKPISRFAGIDEDARPLRLLVSDY